MNPIAFILLKQLRGEPLDAVESTTLAEWMAATEQNRKLAEELDNTDMVAAAFAKWEQIDEARGWEKVLRLKNPAPVVEMKKRIWPRWAAAAVFVFLVAGASYLYFGRQRELPVAQAVQHDAAPGRDAAILTIAGGKQIVLDSTARGTISTQGNTAVVNTNGQLVYKNTNEKPTAVLYNTLTTQRGNQYQLVLPDGSKVWLDAASSITYPTSFTGADRTVTITGEAYFEVVHDSQKPFKVNIGNETIEDLGTHFNINAYTDEPAQKTTLLEGSVKVNSVILQPGEQADISTTGKVTVLKDVDVEDVIAWKDGKFRFNSVDMETILRQAARWYDLEIEYKGKVNETFTGGIPRNVNASELLKVLEYSKKVHFEIEGKKIIVTPVNPH